MVYFCTAVCIRVAIPFLASDRPAAEALAKRAGESEHRESYRLLGVDEKIMSPKTIWSETGSGES